MHQSPDPGLPEGALALLFTDIEGSTLLVDHVGAPAYGDIQLQHNELLRTIFSAHGGFVVDTHGDAFFAVFPHVSDAAAAAIQAQQDLAAQHWPYDVILRVRMGLHVGEPLLVSGNYVGITVNRTARICAAGHGGQVLLSEVAWSMLSEELPLDVAAIDLGVFRLKDLSRPQQLFQLVGPGLDQDFPQPRALEAAWHNLPIQLTTFVGRQTELGEILHLLGERRLVTLVGVGGSGKTRLALQVAAEGLSQYPDGVWLVDLASMSDGDLVASTVVAALDIAEQPLRSPEETLLDHLRGKRLLILMDNCDQVVVACASLVDEILSTIPTVTLLATSREVLRVTGETTYAVPPLNVELTDPDLAAAIRFLGSTPESEAVRLFLERASDTHSGFSLDSADAVVITELCRRLEGIPLAIELAAARARHMAPEQMLDRLTDRFRLLTAGSRSAPDRHQTLQASIDWCHELLLEHERLLFRRLAVFRGGWTLSAAEGVCVDEAIAEQDVLDLLAQLVDKSLVSTHEAEHGYRYRYLETIREYALNRLMASGEADHMRSRHLDWYRHLALDAEENLSGPDQEKWLGRLDAEGSNLQAALEWSAVDDTDTDTGLELVAALARWWDVRARWTEGRRLAEPLINAAEGAAAPIFLARALNTVGQLANRAGDSGAARAYHERALGVARSTGDKSVIASSLRDLGVAALDQGDLAAARSLEEESLGLRRQIGDPLSIAVSLNTLGTVALLSNDLDTAQRMLEESVAIKRELGDSRGVAISLLNLANIVAQRDNDLVQAETFSAESLETFRVLGDRRSTARALNNLGMIAAAQNDLARARTFFDEALTTYGEIGDQENVAEMLVELAELALLQNDLQGARAQMEEACTIYSDLGHKEGIAYVRTALDGMLAETAGNGTTNAEEPGVDQVPNHEPVPEDA